MKIRFLLTLLLAISMEVPMALGHAWSEQMKQELNAPPPDWLSIGAPIKVEPDGTTTKGEPKFRPRSGGVTNSRNRVQIPARGIEIRLDYEIDWSGDNDAGVGASLNPDGTKLIINSGMRSRVLEILPDGSHRAIELRLPHVTYDGGSKGFITGWSWADNQTLIGNAEIDTEQGEFIERRIYVFHVKESALSRLDLSALNLPTTEGLRVSKVGHELDRLSISVGNSEFTVKADLKSPPKIEKKEADSPTAAPHVEPTQQASKAPGAKPTVPAPSEEHASSTPWGIIVLLTMAAGGLLWLLLKRRS